MVDTPLCVIRRARLFYAMGHDPTKKKKGHAPMVLWIRITKYFEVVCFMHDMVYPRTRYYSIPGTQLHKLSLSRSLVFYICQVFLMKDMGRWLPSTTSLKKKAPLLAASCVGTKTPCIHSSCTAAPLTRERASQELKPIISGDIRMSGAFILKLVVEHTLSFSNKEAITYLYS